MEIQHEIQLPVNMVTMKCPRVLINTSNLEPGLTNGRQSIDDIFKGVFLTEHSSSLIQISLGGPKDNQHWFGDGLAPTNHPPTQIYTYQLMLMMPTRHPC